MDIKKSDLIANLSTLLDSYSASVNNSFEMFEYNFKFIPMMHFVDRVIQRYPTWDVVKGIIESVLDSFVKYRTDIISKGISTELNLNLVNIRHTGLQKQNVLSVNVVNTGSVVEIRLVTIFKSNTSFINAGNGHVLLHKKPKFTRPGTVGTKLQNYAKNNDVPLALKQLTSLWS